MPKHLTALLLLTSCIYASSTASGMSSAYIGISKANYSNDEKSRNKPYVGIDIMSQLSGPLYAGVGLDLVAIDGLRATNSTYGNYTLSPQLKLGYSLKELIQWDANLKIDIGYGVTRWNSKNYWSSQYSASFNTKIYEDFGIGYKYKFVNLDVENNINSYYTNIFFIELFF